MTVTLTMRAKQQADGAPLDIQATVLSTNPDSDTFPNTRLATTVTSAVPATFSALAHSDVANYNTAIWDSVTDQNSHRYGGGVSIPTPETVSLSVLKRLDSDYAAGKYLWWLGFASATPAGSDAPTQHAGPYLIA